MWKNFHLSLHLIRFAIFFLHRKEAFLKNKMKISSTHIFILLAPSKQQWCPSNNNLEMKRCRVKCSIEWITKCPWNQLFHINVAFPLSAVCSSWPQVVYFNRNNCSNGNSYPQKNIYLCMKNQIVVKWKRREKNHIEVGYGCLLSDVNVVASIPTRFNNFINFIIESD
jgi:hypothetical protein